MMSPEYFHRVITHQQKGVAAAFWRTLFQTIRPLYAAGVFLRNRQYDWAAPHRAGVPVISVGNLTLGGTGKTPMVIWLAAQLQQQDRRVAVLSRGYHAPKGELNDEGKEIEHRLPDVLQIQQPDRVAAAKCAVETLRADTLLLDDGFQHRRLHRDLNLVLIDATQPFGINGKLFPVGTLREPVRSLARAEGLILTRSEFLSPEERQALHNRIFREIPLKKDCFWAETELRPTAFENAAGETLPLDAFADKSICAFCGIGNPSPFFAEIQRLGISLDIGKNTRTFPDHCSYGEGGTATISAWREAENPKAFLCTGKDIVKLPTTHLDGVPLFFLRTELVFLTGEATLRERLDAIFR